MLLLFLLLAGFQMSYGQDLKNSSIAQTPGPFNLRHYCIVQHSSSKYKVSCNGSTKHFKDNKNIFLDSRSTNGLTEIELSSFESITIVSKTSSDWERLEKIVIKSCKTVIINFESTLKLNKLEIDSVEEIRLKSEQSTYKINAQAVVLSNVGKLNLTSSKNASIKANVLYLSNVKDVDFYGNLRLSGELLTISQSNLDVTEHSMLFLKFASIAAKESTKLYIEGSGQLNISTDNFLVQESYIYLNGQLSITDYQLGGNQKVIKFLNNSFYNMNKRRLHINGDKNEIEFAGNGIYSSDIGDVLNLIGSIEGVVFTNNHFGCNKCVKKQTLQIKHLEYLGEKNFCDLTCNISLIDYKILLDQELICGNNVTYVDSSKLCSIHLQPSIKSAGLGHVWWFLIPVVVVFLVTVSVLIYFYHKRHSPRFRTMPVASVIVLPKKVENSQENQRVILRAFNNDVYGRVENTENIYESVEDT